MTPKAFSIHFLLKTKSGLANMWKLEIIKQDKKDSWLANSPKFKEIGTFKATFFENYYIWWSALLSLF